jgi:hypothetical protein
VQAATEHKLACCDSASPASFRLLALCLSLLVSRRLSLPYHFIFGDAPNCSCSLHSAESFGWLPRLPFYPGTANLQISPPGRPSIHPTLLDMHLSQNIAAC